MGEAAEAAVLPDDVQVALAGARPAAIDRDLRDDVPRANEGPSIRVPYPALVEQGLRQQLVDDDRPGPGGALVRRAQERHVEAADFMRVLVVEDEVEDVDQVAVR